LKRIIMDALGPVIYLNDVQDFRPIRLFRDWAVDEYARTVLHRPSKLLFRIDCPSPDNDGAPGASLPLAALSARVVHVCNGAQLPAMHDLHRIGKDAILAFVIIADAFPPPPDHPDDIPF
jgi:hypothetical protein